MKFKVIEVTDTIKRQMVMEVASEKEQVLFADKFSSPTNTNHEFVIGLELEVRDFSQLEVERLANELKTKFETIGNNRQYAIAIHSKKLVDEVHFHISYLGAIIDADTIYNLYR